MKKISISLVGLRCRAASLIVASVLSVTAFSARAQTSTNPPAPANWFQTAAQWVSSSDTNSTTFDASAFTLWTGNSYLNNSVNASTLGMDVRLFRSTNSGIQLTLESETDNAGVAGTLYSQQIGLQLGKASHDLRFGFFLDGGYSFQEKRPFLEPGIDFRKALGKVSFVYGRVGYQIINKQAAGVFEAGIGIVF